MRARTKALWLVALLAQGCAENVGGSRGDAVDAATVDAVDAVDNVDAVDASTDVTGDAVTDVAEAARDVTLPPSRPPVATFSLPMAVSALEELPDGTLVVGGGWDARTPFAGSPPRAEGRWQGALAWVARGPRLLRAELVGALESVQPTLDRDPVFGVVGLALAPDGALVAVTSSGCHPAAPRACVWWKDSPASPARPLASMGGEVDHAMLAAVHASAARATVCLTYRWERQEGYPGAPRERGESYDCASVRANGDLTALSTDPGDLLRRSYKGIGYTTLAAPLVDDGVATLGQYRCGDGDAWDQLSRDELDRVNGRTFLVEAGGAPPLRRSSMLLPDEAVSLVRGRDGRPWVLAFNGTQRAYVRIDPAADGVSVVRSFVRVHGDLDAFTIHDHATVARGRTREGGLLLVLQRERTLRVVEVTPDAELRVVVTTTARAANGEAPIAVAETARGWVLAQSVPFFTDTPVSAQLAWFDR